MELLLLGFALSTIQLFGLIAIFLLFCISAAYDRRGQSAFKWIVLFGAFIVVGLNVNPTFDLTVIKNTLLSAAFWTPIVVYIGLGLLYSGLEFALAVRKSVSRSSEIWADFLKDTGARFGRSLRGESNFKGTNEELIKLGRADNASVENRAIAFEVCQRFIERTSDSRDFIGFETNSTTITVEPKIDRFNLSQFIGAWVVFWPFYAISLILGDMLAEIWKTIANVIAKYCGRFVRNAFASAFKVN